MSSQVRVTVSLRQVWLTLDVTAAATFTCKLSGFRQYTGSGGSNACLSVVGRVTIEVWSFTVLIWTFHLKYHRVCLSVILLCYRITCLWFCNKDFVIKGGVICAGPCVRWLCFTDICNRHSKVWFRKHGHALPSVHGCSRMPHEGLLTHSACPRLWACSCSSPCLKCSPSSTPLM